VSGRARTVALAVAGLAVAALLGLAASLVAQDTIALPATSLSGGGRLAPSAPATTTTRPRTTTTTRTTTTQPTTGTGDDAGDDSGRGRGRNRGRGGGDD
jgi:hypothetical protein